MRFGIRLLILIAFILLLSSPKLIGKGSADGGPAHQVRNMHFGVSGGNVNDINRRFCCSGTRGALGTAGATFYTLSNTHVWGRSGQASADKHFSRRGLVDSNCTVSTVGAAFTIPPPLGSNVDAAIAQLMPEAMD